MVVVKWLLVAVAAVVVLALLAGRLGFLQGTAPDDLGVREGRFKPPSITPNSVSSQAAMFPEHPQRAYAQIAPLLPQGTGPATMARLKQIVEAMPGARVVKSEPDYLYAQFTTPLMQYVDDTEFWFDPAANVVQLRSASRLGKSDLGLNRKRIEAIRAALAATP
jgi:uncharacterized protein (DUF1499 family)